MDEQANNREKIQQIYARADTKLKSLEKTRWQIVKDYLGRLEAYSLEAIKKKLRNL